MKSFLILSLIILTTSVSATEIPLNDGTYKFTHRFAEHPTIPSITLDAKIEDGKITLVNPVTTDVFSEGVIDHGELYWHIPSNQWIVANSEKDKAAIEVGGCTDGPSVIDLEKMEYWTC